MINRGGENVYWIEVENALAGAPGVGEAAAVGVPDEMMGEKVGAVIVPAPGRQLDVDAVIDHCRKRLADFKVPQYIATRERSAAAQPRRQGAQEAAARGDSTGASRFAEDDRTRGRESRCPTFRRCRERSMLGELGVVLGHEHVRFRDEAVANEWPGRYDEQLELDAALVAVNAAKERGVARSSTRPPCSAVATCGS